VGGQPARALAARKRAGALRRRDELRDAQARLLAGSGDGRVLRAANERERAAVAATAGPVKPSAEDRRAARDQAQAELDAL